MIANVLAHIACGQYKRNFRNVFNRNLSTFALTWFLPAHIFTHMALQCFFLYIFFGSNGGGKNGSHSESILKIALTGLAKESYTKSRAKEAGPRSVQHFFLYNILVFFLDSLLILQEYFLEELFQIGLMTDKFSESLRIKKKKQVFILPLLLNDRLNLKLFSLRTLKLLLHGFLVSTVAGENFDISLNHSQPCFFFLETLRTFFSLQLLIFYSQVSTCCCFLFHLLST